MIPLEFPEMEGETESPLDTKEEFEFDFERKLESKLDLIPMKVETPINLESIHHSIPVKGEVTLEDNLEIQLASLQLKEFPIRYQNFSPREQWKEIIPIGSTNVQVGDQTLYHVSLRAFLYNNFRLLEFKTREFRFSFSIELFNDVFFCRESYIQYEITEKLLNSRLEYIFSLFQKIFQGAKIVFQYKDKTSELSIQNNLEVIKFQKLSSLLEDYQSDMQNFVNKKERHFASLKIPFYELEILQYYLNGKTEYDGWINASLPKGEIKTGDSLSFTRIFSYPFQYLSFELEQTFRLKQVLGDIEGQLNLQLNRKHVSVSLRAIEK